MGALGKRRGCGTVASFRIGPDSLYRARSPEPPKRPRRSTVAGPSGDHLQCSIPGPPRKLGYRLKHARLCRSAAQPPDPEISALRGCARRAPGALRGFRLRLGHVKYPSMPARLAQENSRTRQPPPVSWGSREVLKFQTRAEPCRPQNRPNLLSV